MECFVYDKCYFHNRTDVSQGSDVNKTNELKECAICHHWYFLYEGLKFQPDFCNGFHDFSMMSMNLSDISQFG